jgi:hypothetical protein
MDVFMVIRRVRQVAVCLKPSEIEELKRLADEAERSVSDFCARAIRKYVLNKKDD